VPPLAQILKELFDKELDFNNQLVKSWVGREPDHKTADLVLDSIRSVDASLVVVSCLRHRGCVHAVLRARVALPCGVVSCLHHRGCVHAVLRAQVAVEPPPSHSPGLPTGCFALVGNI